MNRVVAGGFALLCCAVAAAAETGRFLPQDYPVPKAEVIAPGELVFELAGRSIRPSRSRWEIPLDGEWKLSAPESSQTPFPAETGVPREALPACDDSGWSAVRVPMNWFRHEKYASFPKEKVSLVRGWYRRTFTLPEDSGAKRLILEFDGAAYEARVFLNGRLIGSHHGEHGSFRFDATGAARPGLNLLAVQVTADFGGRGTVSHGYGAAWGRGNVKGGLWQSVRAWLTDPVRIARLEVTPRLARSSVALDYRIVNCSGRPRTLTLDAVVSPAMKAEAGRGSGRASTGRIELAPGVNRGSLELRLDRPELWSPDRPWLYFASLLLREEERVLDALTVRFGFREFVADGGRFKLNGQPIFLFGENMSPAYYGSRGYTPEEERKRLAGLLENYRRLGYNILRTSHMPVMQAALDLADEYGMMFYHEWCWAFSTNLDFEAFGRDNFEELAEFVADSYNHPSVVMWSLGNEIVHQNRPGIRELLDRQVELVHRLDRSGRPVTSFSGNAEPGTYGWAKLKTDVLDFHSYVGLYMCWTRQGTEIGNWCAALRKVYGSTPGGALPLPLVAWENVGFSWGWKFDDNFRPGDVGAYRKYAQRSHSWAQPAGIGFAGTIGLAAALNRREGPDYAQALYGRRIFEVCRLDGRLAGFAPWSASNMLPEAKLWNQRILPTLHDRRFLRPGNLFAGEDAEWNLTVLNDSDETLRHAVALVTLVTPDGAERELARLTLAEVPAHGRAGDTVRLPLPAGVTGDAALRLRLRQGDGEKGCNFYEVKLLNRADASRRIPAVRPVAVLDTGVPANVAALTAELKARGIAFRQVRSVEEWSSGVLIVPPEYPERQRVDLADRGVLRQRLAAGGVLLVLEQRNPDSVMPFGLRLAYGPNTFVDLVSPGHPLFAGLDRRSFDTWNNPEFGFVIDTVLTPYCGNALAVRGPMLGRGNAESAVVEAAAGRGRVILSQLNAVKLATRDSAAATYLGNLLRYAAGTETLWKEALPAEAADTGFVVEEKNLVPVDLRSHANRAFRDDSESGGATGWLGQGSNDFRMMPLGRRKAASVVFDVIDPASNGNRGCLVVRGSERPEFPAAITGIPVGRKFGRLFFLHTAGWGAPKLAARYRINYADGGSVTIPVIGGRHIGDWWSCGNLPEAKIGLTATRANGHTVGSWVMQWSNPRPECEIATLDFLSAGVEGKMSFERHGLVAASSPVPMLIAVTGETVSASPLEPVGRHFRRGVGTRQGGTLTPEVRWNGSALKIRLPETPPGERPVAMICFDPRAAADDYRYLVMRVRSKQALRFELAIPTKNWSSSYGGLLQLPGGGEWFECRLKLGETLRRNGAPFSNRQLRGELFLHYRQPDPGGAPLPAAELEIERIRFE